jgi:hypothetical protein
MASRDSVVFGIYGKCDAVQPAIELLLSKGFSASDISIALPGNESTRALLHKSSKAAALLESDAARTVQAFEILESLGELALPDLGSFIAAGPIMTTLSGVAAGTHHRSLAAAFIGIGVPEYEARLYENALKEGGALLSVQCSESDQMASAKNLLEHSGAEGVASTIEAVPDDAFEHSGSISIPEAREQAERAIAGPGDLKFKPDPA